MITMLLSAPGRRSTLRFQQLHPTATRSFASGSFQGIIFNMRKEELTLYQVLDVPSKATQKEIKLAYYKLAKKYHPDFQHDITEAGRKEAEVQFKKI